MARARSAPEPAGGLSLVIDRAALAQALASVIKAVATSVQIPILTNLLLAAEGGTLAITGTNLDQQATLRVPATVQGSGSFTVYGQAVHDLARRLAGDAVTIALAPDGHAVTIAAGRSRSTLPTLPVADFPDIAAFRGGGPAYAVEIAGSVLADLFGRCAFAISTEETRYYLCGVLAHAVERDGVPVLRLVATDGRRLARIDAPRATGADLRMPKAIIPAKAVALFTAAAKAAGDAMLRLETTPTTARLILPTGEIVTKLIDGTFPNYDAVTPTTFAREAATATLALAQALDRAGALSEEKDRRVRLDFEADRIGIILPHQADGTTSSDEVEAELSGDPLSIGFNTRYLSEILTLSNVDKVTIRLGADAQQAAVITDRSGDAVYILMPMRV